MLTDPQTGEPLPAPYPWLRKQRFKLPVPWSFIDEAREADTLRAEFLKKMPAGIPVKDLLPFARYHQQGDVAGFVVQGGRPTAQVVCFNLPYSQHPDPAGWPGYQVHEDVWAWLRDAVLEDARKAEQEG